MEDMREQIQEIPDTVLDSICGGTREEIDELRRFIEAHDKNWTYRNAGDIGSWLMLNARLSVAQLMVSEKNSYRGKNGSISHKDLMAQLKKQFS